MNIRISLPLLLGLGATVAVLVGCGSAPASQNAGSASAPQAREIATAVDSVPQAPAVEVGYEVGLRAPEFGMSLLDGAKVTSSDLTNAGKPVFLYFHATF